MADFSLTTLFVVPTTQVALPTGSSTQDLSAGEVGIFSNNYVAVDDPSSYPYFYIAQGRTNTYLQGSKRSDKIKACSSSAPCNSNVTEWYKVKGCPYPLNQITQVGTWANVKCGDVVTVTIRAHSSYIDTLYFNGLTRSVTVQAPCCECGADPCTDVDFEALIADIITELERTAPDFMGGSTTGTNPDNISLSTFFTFSQPAATTLQIEGKALTAYGQPCDVAAFPHEYDRMWFRVWVYTGPATTVDFIVSDACNIIATANVIQESNYAIGTAAEIKQMEKDYYSYQAGYLKNLYRIAGYNANFESWVTDGTTYDTFYIKFNEYDRSANQWGDYIPIDSTVILAVPTGAMSKAFEDALKLALGSLPLDKTCLTTTTTTTSSTTTTTTTLAG